jgi:hypothetical protein
MDATIASVQVGTPVPARSAVPAQTAQPAEQAGAAVRGTVALVQKPKEGETAVTVEHDKRSGHHSVSVVDAVTREVLVLVRPAAVRAVVEGLLEMVEERRKRS